jgi:hypothetical protein
MRARPKVVALIVGAVVVPVVYVEWRLAENRAM